MPLGSSLDAKEQVRQAIDIVELVGKYVQLRRQGRIFVGLCPWHDDRRPSLQVNPERQSFRCFVCDIGGDIFSFIMRMEGVEFPEALAMLADQAGIALKPQGGKPRPAAGSADDKRTLYQAMQWCEKQYHDCLLRSQEAEPARQYLHKRGITAQSVEGFQLGFAPNRGDWILRRADNSPFGAKILEAIGALARSADGGLYDRFRGRVLFSIRDTQGRAVGMGGRVLPESGSTSPAKYINSPETPLFSKSSLLYGLHAARDGMRKAHTALVMEGYTDCIVAHQFGFDNAVAVLGTALGDRHIQTLKRFVDRIVLVLDGDEAGQRRTNEVLELFVSRQVDLRIVTLPEGLDPCDFLQKYGAGPFAEILADQSVDALEHAFRVATQGIDLERDVDGVGRAVERILTVMAGAPRLGDAGGAQQQAREWKILSLLAGRSRIEEAVLRERLKELRRGGQRRAAPAPAAPGPHAPVRAGKLDPWERELLELVVRHPECLEAARREIAPEQLTAGPAREIYAACCRLRETGQAARFNRLMLEFDDPGIKGLLVELDETGQAKGIAQPETIMEDLLKAFRVREASKRRPADTGALREGRLDAGQQVDLLRQIVQRERSRHGISEPTDG